MKARLLMVTFLAGCATQPGPDFAAARDSWIGARYDTVVLQWGAPTRSTVLSDGRDAHTWASETVVNGSWFPSTIGIFGGNYGGGVAVGTTMGGAGGAMANCERTLMFRNGLLTEQSWQGNANYCSTFRKK